MQTVIQYSTILTVLFLGNGNLLNSQVIWSENFNSYGSCITTGSNLNAGNPTADWTTTFQDCDDGGTTCTLNQSFFGTNGGQFRINDIEGGPCTCSTGGTTLNFIITESIDISSATGVAISIAISQTGGFESGTLGGCDNSEDIVHVTYSIDGGPFTQFSTNGFLTGNFGSVSSSQSCLYGGSSLQIRIQAGNKANDEHIFIDNIVVTETGCPPLPVELIDFEVYCETTQQLVFKWQTASEINNSHFIIQGSKEGVYYQDMLREEGNGNSNQPIQYSVSTLNTEKYKYFRLIQYDFDGTARNYDPVFGNCQFGSESIPAFIQDGHLIFSTPLDLEGETEFRIIDMNGKEIYMDHQTNLVKNELIDIDCHFINSGGIYILSVTNANTGTAFHTKFHIGQ